MRKKLLSIMLILCLVICAGAVRAQEEVSNENADNSAREETSVEETAPEEADMLIAPAPGAEESAETYESEPVQDEAGAESSSVDISVETTENIPETSEEIGIKA